MVARTFSECPWALSITRTSSPTRIKSSICSTGFWATPKAAPTRSLPLESLAALGNFPAFSISLVVISPLRCPFLSTTSNFSMRLSCSNCLDFSSGVPSGMVTRSSLVIRERIFLFRLLSNRRSRLVRIPTSFLFCVMGIPLMLYFRMTSRASLIFWSGPMVIGSGIMALTERLTLSTILR